MSDKPELPPASQAQVHDQPPALDDHGETSNATQETGVNSKSELACDQPDRKSLCLLLSLSPNNSLRHPSLRSLGNPASTQNEDGGSGNANAHGENIAITPLSSSQNSQERLEEGSANCSYHELAASSDEESVHKPVEATDTPTGRTSALVPSSSPPKSKQYLTDLAKILNTYVEIPSQTHVDPADQHRNVCAEAAKKVKRRPISAHVQKQSQGQPALVPIEGALLCSIMREKVVKSIAKTLLSSEFPLPSFTVDDVKVCCILHPQGLDDDWQNHSSMTLTATLLLPQNTNARKITLAISAYDGEITENKDPISNSSAYREVTDENRTSCKLHMTVQKIASQKDIIFKTTSDKIGFKIKVRIEAG